MEGRATVGGAPDSRYCMMSRLVTRPAIPVPCIPAISTPCSAAILRTSGDDFVRTRSSKLLPLPAVAAFGRAPSALEPETGVDVSATADASADTAAFDGSGFAVAGLAGAGAAAGAA